MSDHAPKVLLVGPLPPPVSGLSKAFALLVEGLPPRGWTVDVVNLMSPEGRRTSKRWRSVAKAIVEVVSKVGAPSLFYLTISQSRAGFLKDLIFLEAAHRAKVPSVVHLHGGYFAEFYASQPAAYRYLIRRALAPCRKLIVLGESLRRELSMVPGWEEKTVVVPNPTDVPLLPARKAPRTDETLRVLYLSNLVVGKGYQDVLTAGPALSKLLPGRNIELHFAGEPTPSGSDFTSPQAMVEDFEKRQREIESPSLRVIRHGAVHGLKKAALLSDCHVFVLPTYYRYEGQPIAVLEALASALPVVTTAHRGIPDVLPASHRAHMVSPRDPEGIAQSIARWAHDSAAYEAASLEAREAGSAYTLERHMETMDHVLRSALL